MHPPDPHLEELDLSVPDMRFPEEERRVETLLRGLPGVASVLIVQSGVWIAYRPTAIMPEQILSTLHAAGFRASTFQDSESGKTGSSSV
jgi:hypothetical protein